MPLYPDMPQVPGGLGAAEGLYQSPAQRLARKRTKSIFGVQIPSRRGATLLGGLANMPQIQAGGFGANFLSGLQGGLHGALGAGGQYDAHQAAQQEAEQKRQDEMISQRRLGEAAQRDETRLGYEAQRVGMEQQRLDNPKADTGVVSFSEWVKMTPEQRAEYSTFKNVGDANSTGQRLPQFSARDRALINKYKFNNKGATDDDAVLAIQEGRFGARPVATETQSQARDEYGAPLYIDSTGRVTTEPQDKKSLQPNKPMMTQTKRFYGSPWDTGQPPNPLDEFIR